MARRRLPPNDPREWLNRAGSNLTRQAGPLDGVYLEDCCFDAQQAAEKAIKAVFLAHGLDGSVHPRPGKTADHSRSIGRPRAEIRPRSGPIDQGSRSNALSGLSSPVTKPEHRRAVRIATRVLGWATRQVELRCP